MTLKTVIFVLVQIQKVINYVAKNADFFTFIGYPNLNSMLTADRATLVEAKDITPAPMLAPHNK